MFELPKTLIEANRDFSDPDTCQEFIVSLRWPDRMVTGARCGCEDLRYTSTRRWWEYKDKYPKRQFSIRVGTIFEYSPVDLDESLATIWLIASAKPPTRTG